MSLVKKVLVCILMVSMLIVGFSACGNGNANTSDQAASTVSSQGASTAAAGEKDTAAAKPVTLKFFTNEAVMAEKFQLINDEYKKRNPNVTVDVIQVPNADYYTKVDTTILSGEQLDVCYWNIKFDYVPRAAKGEFVAMDDFLKGEGKTITDLYTIDSTVDDGHVYALPGDVKEWVVWMNKNDLDKVGLTVPPLNWTWDDYREYAKKLTWGEGENKHYGSMFFNWDHFNVLTAYNRLDGNPYFKADGSLNFDDPAFAESVKLRHDLEMVDKTQIPLSEIIAMELDYRTAFMGGRTSMVVMATNTIPQIAQTKDYPHDFVTTFASLPIPKGGREGYTYADNRFYCIGKTTGNAEEAYKYLRYFTTEGIPMKNVTFTADKSGTVTMEQMVNNMTSANPALFDSAQLIKVLTNPQLKANIWTNVPEYTSEIVNMYKAEAEKAVMGEITPEQAVKNALEQGKSVLAKYGK